MAMYSICDLGRREILMMSAVLAGAGVAFSPRLAAAEATLQRTPDQILGPFLSALRAASNLRSDEGIRSVRSCGRAGAQRHRPGAEPCGRARSHRKGRSVASQCLRALHASQRSQFGPTRPEF